MGKNPKTKLCWNCEGRVSINAESCPFCGVSVVPASLDPAPSTFSPPYRMGESQSQQHIPRSPYLSVEEEKEEEEQDEMVMQEVTPLQKTEPVVADDFKDVLLSTLLLLSGSVFFLFGLILFVFSTHGVFTLQWDATVWFIYIGLALPLLFFGWRSLARLS